MKRQILIYQRNKIVLVLATFIYLVMLRFSSNYDISFMKRFYQSYNERRFLSLYLSVFLLTLFPVLKKFYMTEMVIRSSKIWDFVILILKEIGMIALLYSIMITIGWFFIIGSGAKDWMAKESLLYIAIIFFTQVIGWMLIGMIEGLIYILLKNLPLTFIMCETFFIMTNLSLYLSDNQQFIHYIRLYDFMFDLSKINNLFTIISMSFFYIVVIMMLAGLSYNIMKKHDFIPGGKKSYEKK